MESLTAPPLLPSTPPNPGWKQKRLLILTAQRVGKRRKRRSRARSVWCCLNPPVQQEVMSWRNLLRWNRSVEGDLQTMVLMAVNPQSCRFVTLNRVEQMVFEMESKNWILFSLCWSGRRSFGRHRRRTSFRRSVMMIRGSRRRSCLLRSTSSE